MNDNILWKTYDGAMVQTNHLSNGKAFIKPAYGSGYVAGIDYALLNFPPNDDYKPIIGYITKDGRKIVPERCKSDGSIYYIDADSKIRYVNLLSALEHHSAAEVFILTESGNEEINNSRVRLEEELAKQKEDKASLEKTINGLNEIISKKDEEIRTKAALLSQQETIASENLRTIQKLNAENSSLAKRLKEKSHKIEQLGIQNANLQTSLRNSTPCKFEIGDRVRYSFPGHEDEFIITDIKTSLYGYDIKGHPKFSGISAEDKYLTLVSKKSSLQKTEDRTEESNMNRIEKLIKEIEDLNMSPLLIALAGLDYDGDISNIRVPASVLSGELWRKTNFSQDQTSLYRLKFIEAENIWYSGDTKRSFEFMTKYVGPALFERGVNKIKQKEEDDKVRELQVYVDENRLDKPTYPRLLKAAAVVFLGFLIGVSITLNGIYLSGVKTAFDKQPITGEESNNPKQSALISNDLASESL